MTALTPEALAARLRADDLLHNRGPDYEPLRIPASALRLEAADAIEALRAQVEALTGELNWETADRRGVVEAMRSEARSQEELLTAATSRALAAETALAEASDQLSAVLLWSREPCPCKDEKPDPCPLCGASVADGVCKAGTRLPDLLWGRINLAIAQARIARGPDHG